MDAKLKQDKDENALAERLISAARESCNVLGDRELVNYYIRGLLPSTRDAMAERVRQLPTQEQGDITAARRVAQEKGSTYRARRAASEISTPRSETKPSLLVTDDLGADYMTQSSSPCWSPSGRELEPGQSSGKQSYWAQLRHEDLQQAARFAQNLKAYSKLETPLTKEPYLNAPKNTPFSSASYQDSDAETELSPPCQLYSPPSNLNKQMKGRRGRLKRSRNKKREAKSSQHVVQPKSNGKQVQALHLKLQDPLTKSQYKTNKVVCASCPAHTTSCQARSVCIQD